MALPVTDPYAGPVPPQFKGGFEASFDDALNRSGPRRIDGRSRRGGARYTEGPFRGLTLSQAMALHRDAYARMSDQQRKAWEAKAGFVDVRSSRERGGDGSGYAGPQSDMQALAMKTGRWHSGDGKIKQGFDAASPAYKAQLIGMFGSEEAARAQFGGGWTASQPGNTEPKRIIAPRAGMIDGKPAAQAIEEATKAARGGELVLGGVNEDGSFQPPEGGGELVGMSGGKPLYEQRAAQYTGPDTPTKAAATGVRKPGEALKKAKRAGVGV